MELIFKDELFAIMGAAMDVHRELGSGFLESDYHEALTMELARRQIPYESQKPIKIHYKGELLAKEFVADLICLGQIIIELKAQDSLSSEEEAQVLN